MIGRKWIGGLGMLALAACAGELDIAYPRPCTLFQRDSSAEEGVVRLRGSFPEAQRPERMEARFNGGA